MLLSHHLQFVPLLSHLRLALPVNRLHFAGGWCSGSCGNTIQCKTICHPFQLPLLIYSQLHRHLLCILLSVCLILSFLLYLWVLTFTWTAILICLEHSFWIAQQASNPNDGFIKAWKYYLKTQRALVDEELDKYLRSTGSNDWFTVKPSPSEKECAEFRGIVLNNLLCESSPCLLLFWAGIADISSVHSKTST